LWERGTSGSYLFCQIPRTKVIPITITNLPTFSIAPQPKAKAPQPSTQAFPTKGNSNKNVKKKEDNANKSEVFQAMPLKFKFYKMNSNH
jgi:hypothetical protein